MLKNSTNPLLDAMDSSCQPVFKLHDDSQLPALSRHTCLAVPKSALADYRTGVASTPTVSSGSHSWLCISLAISVSA